MKKRNKYLIHTVVVASIFAGCSSEGNEPSLSERRDCPDFTATIGNEQSRAFNQSWEKGDEIGINGCSRSNICYATPDGDGNFQVKQTGNQIYFQNDNEATFTAYYPWTNLTSGTSITADTRLQGNQKRFDFLWATGNGKKDAPVVALTFAHRMAKVTFTLLPGEDMTYDEIKTVKFSLKGCRLTGTFNTVNGTTTTGDISDSWSFTEFGVANPTAQNLTFSLIFFPQVFQSPLEFSGELTTPDNRPFNLKANIDFTGANREKDGTAAKNEWVAGRQYNLTLTLNKTEITVNQCQINPWSEVKGDDIVVD